MTWREWVREFQRFVTPLVDTPDRLGEPEIAERLLRDGAKVVQGFIVMAEAVEALEMFRTMENARPGNVGQLAVAIDKHIEVMEFLRRVGGEEGGVT